MIGITNESGIRTLINPDEISSVHTPEGDFWGVAYNSIVVMNNGSKIKCLETLNEIALLIKGQSEVSHDTTK